MFGGFFVARFDLLSTEQVSNHRLMVLGIIGKNKKAGRWACFFDDMRIAVDQLFTKAVRSRLSWA